ncbi:arsenate reductase ArsC [Sulfitobacter sp. M57]|uniref:arsenate reductase ArsC n=1 Tax=unclassified Sulfitobacter TaxID=196795 RepID=UPI0023E0E995|nr:MULTISPECIES: arsenate reductase ArsC [unclassified Sulfitobacter]MDF3413793.1 arsenate reductase ArsC [Sulfitobacter sp. KE5]MDF3420926.1 arsenate reductase ArsC [Sulfitobacter sp. KE43]MDF3432339.1 arsenate reductase ArsC [Sulfitobacter sp. KE42]MDF3457978.1 arsenate reductase ArsC [Sulfitobacter sp. S74]MDF3461879.1 arsenate reductase ArsC [Sulfitobacter sp. Ks18]
MNILVLCTGNSARSILLESALNRLGSGRVTAFSAGSQPAGRVNPHALTLLAAKGHDTAGLRSKSWDEFGHEDAPHMDLVITVCGSAAAETCPMWPGAPLRAHWGVEDPAAVPDADAPAAFAEADAILTARAQAFLGEPVETLEADALRAHLQTCAAVT